MVRAGTPKNSIRLYIDVLRSVLNAARSDKLISDIPTEGIDLAQFLRGCHGCRSGCPRLNRSSP
jgi:hypothetical protein